MACRLLSNRYFYSNKHWNSLVQLCIMYLMKQDQCFLDNNRKDNKNNKKTDCI